MKIISSLIVLIFAVYLIGLTILIYWKPSTARRFLNLFASSAKAHYLEQILRLLAGSALILYAPNMKFPLLFEYFGWLLIVTTIFLLIIPWQWHHKFGQWVIPLVIQNLNIYGNATFALGTFMLYGLFVSYL